MRHGIMRCLERASLGLKAEEGIMYIINGIAYAGTRKEERKVESVRILDGMILLVKFKSGEERLFDATSLLEYPAFQPLRDDRIFRNVKVEFGTLSWNDGNIDIDPETLYEESYPYESKPAAT